MNVLCMGARGIGPATEIHPVKEFPSAAFTCEPRHARSITNNQQMEAATWRTQQ